MTRKGLVAGEDGNALVSESKESHGRDAPAQAPAQAQVQARRRAGSG